MKMKKVVLSLAGVLAAAAFAPEASAVPVFARQTGMACSACHFNHFPLLNAFGRSFKASGYTLMGAQGKVEGEDLSIPDRVNMAVLATAGYEAASKSGASGAGTNFSGWFVPTNGGELSIFFGGRISEYAGFLSELGLTGGTNDSTGTATTAVGAPGGKILILPEVSNGTRAGVGLFSIGQDVASSFELLNTGASSIHKLMPKPGYSNAHLNASSARQYVAPESASAGVALIAVNTDVGFLNISKYASAGPGTTKVGVNGLPATYVRAAGFFQLAGFDSAVGIQNWSGEQNVVTNTLASGGGAQIKHTENKATVVDFQMQGDLGGKGFGFYAAYGQAPNTSATANGGGFNGQTYAANLQTKTAFTLAADYSVAPKMTINGGLRWGKIPTGATNNNGGTAALVTAAGSTQTDNAVSVGFGYELAMNQHLIFDYTTQSGTSYNAGTGVNSTMTGKTVSTLILESLF